MKTFSHTRPIRDKDTGEITGQRPAPVRRVTVGELPGNYGHDKDKRLVVSLEAGDVIRIRVERTSLSRSVTIAVVDLWAHLQRCKANKATLEKARTAKQKKADRLIEQRENRQRAKWKREGKGTQ